MSREAPEPESDETIAGQSDPAPANAPSRRKVSAVSLLVGVLVALLGFALVAQFQSNTSDTAHASAREADLLQIMADLDSAERRLKQDIARLEEDRRDLQSGAIGRQAAVAEAEERDWVLGVLMGTRPARGPGVVVQLVEGSRTIEAGTLLTVVQELRGAGAEALQIDGRGGSVRVVASSHFVDSDRGVTIDGTELKAPYVIRAVGDPAALEPALYILGGANATVERNRATMTATRLELVEVLKLRPFTRLEDATPAR